MNSPASENKLMQSYVWHEGLCFFVSTIDRDSSAVLAHGARYAETMVWGYDWAGAKRLRLEHQDEGSQGTIYTHIQICEALHAKGLIGVKDSE